jgi:glycosyltransferase XagB
MEGSLPGARDGASPAQKGIVFLGLCAIVAIVTSSAQPTVWLALAASPVFLGVIAIQLGAAFEKAEPPGFSQPIGDQRDHWPRYTVLAPLYREAAVVEQFIRALSSLDYPGADLEVLLLLEAHDAETRAALERLSLPDAIRLVLVPEGAPRTKPRALNYGLGHASGVYVTIFDAEDLPDPDQLKRAVLAFEAAPPEVMCLQARLAIDNGPDGWLPLMMAIEYAALFDAIKCGLAVSAWPVALGGTSNHFRREDLVRLGGWDAWNVTEDADLGLRIARLGGQVEDLNSTTLEEAPVSLAGWFGQRRRWLKGWTQTGICHARQPWRGIRAMGLAPWTVGLMQVFGMVIGALTFPLFAAWSISNIWTGDILDNTTWLAFVVNSIALNILLVGGLAMLLPAILGLWRRRMWHLIPWLVTLPVYLLLISAAAWAAMWELIRRPFHWNKTKHGLGRRRPETFRSRR